MPHSAASFVLSLSQFKLRLILGVLLLNLFAFGLAGYSLYRDRQQYEQRTVVATQNMAQLLERDISAVFARIDYTLHTMADEIEKQLAGGRLDEARLNALLRKYQFHLPEVSSLRMADAQGMVRYGDGVTPSTRVSISDREHFNVPRTNPQVGLVIARPVMARIDQVWSIPMARRLNKPDGAFAGIVYINLPVAQLVRMFSGLKLGSHGLVSLRDLNYVSMARYPETLSGAGALGQVGVSNELLALLMSGRSHGTYMAPSPADHMVRTYTFYKLPAYPLFLVVGQAPQDYLSDWWTNVIETLVLVLTFVLISAVLTLLIFRSWRRQLGISEALRDSEERWSLALEGGSFTVWDWDLPNDQVKLSKLGKALFGFAEDEIGDRMADWARRCHPDDLAQVVAQAKDHFRYRAPTFVAEYRVRCKDERWRWILTRGMVVRRDGHGKPLRMIGTHTDVTERHRRENELRLAATAFDIADEAVVVTSPQNKIISVNPAFTRITGYTPLEVIGHNPSLLSAKTQSKAFYQDMWTQLMTTNGWRGEVMNRKKSGEVYVEWLSIKRVLDAQGKLNRHVAVFSDITDRKVAEQRMKHLALHDALTDLPNRTLLTERIKQAILQAQRNHARLGLMYFDLDKFKPVNDSFGHEVGDSLLKAVAQRVLDCVRASDTVARLGGDEFVVLLLSPETDQDAWGVAEKIRTALEQPFEVAGQTLNISTSMGLAIYPEHGSDEQSLTAHADAAMYQAKKNGRNRVVLYQSGMSS